MLVEVCHHDGQTAAHLRSEAIAGWETFWEPEVHGVIHLLSGASITVLGYIDNVMMRILKEERTDEFGCWVEIYAEKPADSYDRDPDL